MRLHAPWASVKKAVAATLYIGCKSKQIILIVIDQVTFVIEKKHPPSQFSSPVSDSLVASECCSKPCCLTGPRRARSGEALALQDSANDNPLATRKVLAPPLPSCPVAPPYFSVRQYSPIFSAVAGSADEGYKSTFWQSYVPQFLGSRIIM